MSRGWEDELDRMMRDPFQNLRRDCRNRRGEEYPAEFYEPLDGPAEDEEDE